MSSAHLACGRDSGGSWRGGGSDAPLEATAERVSRQCACPLSLTLCYPSNALHWGPECVPHAWSSQACDAWLSSTEQRMKWPTDSCCAMQAGPGEVVAAGHVIVMDQMGSLSLD